MVYSIWFSLGCKIDDASSELSQPAGRSQQQPGTFSFRDACGAGSFRYPGFRQLEKGRLCAPRLCWLGYQTSHKGCSEVLLSLDFLFSGGSLLRQHSSLQQGLCLQLRTEEVFLSPGSSPAWPGASSS